MESKKVSVKFFLNKKLKGDLFKGVMYYPIYARIIFLENNTNIRVNKRSGGPSMMNEAAFNEFELMMYSGNYPRELLYTRPENHILGKEILIEKAILFEYEKVQDRFNFKEFTRKYKIWEKDLYFSMLEAFIIKAKELAYERAKDIDSYNSIDFDQIVYSDSELNKWKGVVGESIDTKLIDLGASLVSVTYFNQYLYREVLKFSVLFSYYPNERSTVFSWLHGTDKIDFNSFVNNSAKKFKPDNIVKETYLSKSFIELFPLEPSKLAVYEEKIDSIIKSLNIN